ALGLEGGQGALIDEVLGEGRGLGPRVPLEELADDRVELAAVDQPAAAEVPDEPFARAEVTGHHERRPSGVFRASRGAGPVRRGRRANGGRGPRRGVRGRTEN